MEPVAGFGSSEIGPARAESDGSLRIRRSPSGSSLRRCPMCPALLSSASSDRSASSTAAAAPRAGRSSRWKGPGRRALLGPRRAHRATGWPSWARPTGGRPSADGSSSGAHPRCRHVTSQAGGELGVDMRPVPVGPTSTGGRVSASAAGNRPRCTRPRRAASGRWRAACRRSARRGGRGSELAALIPNPRCGWSRGGAPCCASLRYQGEA